MYFEDPELEPFADIIKSRLKKGKSQYDSLVKTYGSLSSYCNYHDFFGLHQEKEQWVFREWAPNAECIYVINEKTSWDTDARYLLEKKEGGVFERYFPIGTFSHQDLFRLKVFWNNGSGDRLPTAATRVVQDYHTNIFNAQVWNPEEKYLFRIKEKPVFDQNLLIYETHVGMALEDGRVGTYLEFEKYILPQILEAGYNAIQIMAIPEHPYYGSFGYHVANFFAPSSRFGTPEELKSLIDSAHEHRIRVFMDIIHSHAVNNEVEGISRFDGTHYQFFHDGERGHHRLWDSRCFDYSKPRVVNFLLSNLKYWIEEFHVDGFRFDGITSMLFLDHGIGRSFVSYDDYYRDNVDLDALSYLYLANRLVHELKPGFATIAEDVSGYPGLAAETSKGGTGFDYRYAMGIADHWIKLLKEYRDEDWDLGKLWYELTTHRKEEKTISYSESHDQALVGDQTLMMRLMGENIYQGMQKENSSIKTTRAVALHKMIRLITLATAGSGYLNFMGNEFGHPEWIDFPSQMNHFSYHYARRQWSLKHDKRLFYASLFEFDREMTGLVKKYDLFSSGSAVLVHMHQDDKVIAFSRSELIFIFNFHPEKSFVDYMFEARPGRYTMVFNSDEKRFGGSGRLKEDQEHFTIFSGEKMSGRNMLSLYLPSRCAVVLFCES